MPATLLSYASNLAGNNQLLNKSNSLMDIYKEENINDYNTFLNKDNNIKKDRKRILSSLPLFTINDTLLIKILKRNNINEEDINKILEYKNIEFIIVENNSTEDKTFVRTES
mgnify:CR=1 FL=1